MRHLVAILCTQLNFCFFFLSIASTLSSLQWSNSMARSHGSHKRRPEKWKEKRFPSHHKVIFSNLFNKIWQIVIWNCIFFREAVQAVVQDLTQTLTKDIRKRMCETLGFHLFEKWWQEQEIKYKEKVRFIPLLAFLGGRGDQFFSHYDFTLLRNVDTNKR